MVQKDSLLIVAHVVDPNMGSKREPLCVLVIFGMMGTSVGLS